METREMSLLEFWYNQVLWVPWRRIPLPGCQRRIRLGNALLDHRDAIATPRIRSLVGPFLLPRLEWPSCTSMYCWRCNGDGFLGGTWREVSTLKVPRTLAQRILRGY